jgi:hypothetical protein
VVTCSSETSVDNSTENITLYPGRYHGLLSVLHTDYSLCSCNSKQKKRLTCSVQFVELLSEHLPGSGMQELVLVCRFTRKASLTLEISRSIFNELCPP